MLQNICCNVINVFFVLASPKMCDAVEKNFPIMDSDLYKFCKNKEVNVEKEAVSLSMYGNEQWDEEDVEHIVRTINQDLQLKELFGNNMPQFLSSEGFEVKMNTKKSPVIIGEGVECSILFAEETRTQKLVAVKLFKNKDYNIVQFLREYAYTRMSHNVLNGHVKGMEMKGIISLNRTVSESTFKYAMVLEFASLIPGSSATLTLNEAIDLGYELKFNIISQQNWAQIILALISATEQLKDNQICHLDLHGNNIMLGFTEKGVTLIIIDFGDAKGFYGSKHEPLYKRKGDEDEVDGYIAPELFHQGIPLPTSDLYSVTYFALEIAELIGLERLGKVFKKFRKSDPVNRKKHAKLQRKCMRYLQHLFY